MERLNPRDYRLAIAGEGILLPALRRECDSKNLRHVTFLGHVRNRDLLADYYANADIFIHPNPCEPFGIAPLEGMSSGLALVAPNRGGVTSYANSTNAWLVEPRAEAFAQAVAEVLAGGDIVHRKIEAARRTAEEHRWQTVTRRYLQLYRELNAVTQGEPAGLTIAARSYSTPARNGIENKKTQKRFARVMTL